ncbi:unnamed protein product [Brugia timori]|nr:unnamed protein product [Brugia timori]
MNLTTTWAKTMKFPVKKTRMNLMKTLNLCMQQDIISIESSSLDNITQNDRIVLSGLLEFGYINETMLPWNSGQPLLIKIIWGSEAHNAGEFVDFEVL